MSSMILAIFCSRNVTTALSNQAAVLNIYLSLKAIGHCQDPNVEQHFFDFILSLYFPKCVVWNLFLFNPNVLNKAKTLKLFCGSDRRQWPCWEQAQLKCQCLVLYVGGSSLGKQSAALWAGRLSTTLLGEHLLHATLQLAHYNLNYLSYLYSSSYKEEMAAQLQAITYLDAASLRQ